MHRLTVSHVRRWHLHRKTVGCGHLYQGTYKSFPVESDEHLLARNGDRSSFSAYWFRKPPANADGTLRL